MNSSILLVSVEFVEDRCLRLGGVDIHLGYRLCCVCSATEGSDDNGRC